jgi:hypothetical protein
LLERVSQDEYKTLSFVAANESTGNLTKEFITDDIDKSVTGVIHAKKLIEEAGSFDIATDIDEDVAEAWQREVRKIRMQAAVEFKLRWFYDRQGIFAGVITDERTPQKETEDVLVPRGGLIDFDKYEKEREGLICPDTVRITEKNLLSFKDDLPRDVIYNMIRPYYRGLALREGEDDTPRALMVWELFDMDYGHDPRAEIRYFMAEDDMSGRRLLEEYTHELSVIGAVESTILAHDLRNHEADLLREDGFELKETEDPDIEVPLGEITGLSPFKKAPEKTVYSLAEITDKQYRRGISYVLSHRKELISEDLAFLTKDWFASDISCCTIENDRVTGMLLLHGMPGKRLMIDLLYAGGADRQADIIDMIRFSVTVADKNYDSDTRVIIRRHDRTSWNVSDRIFPGKKGRTVLCGKKRYSEV